MPLTAEQLQQLANQLIQEAEQKGAHLRLLGGLAFYVNSQPAKSQPGLQREYKDLDFAVDKKGAKVIPQVFADQGWTEDRRFNALHGKTRMLFTYQNEFQADIFIGSFEQCHTLDLEDRLALHPVTLPLSDLLLTKLQIHKLNAKDVQDTLSILLSHDLSDHPQAGEINLGDITSLTSNDWGWYTTIHDNLEVLSGEVGKYLQGDAARLVHERINKLHSAMEVATKSLRWKLRSQIGRRVPWYDEPEEVLR
jgi:hypothetical protein